MSPPSKTHLLKVFSGPHVGAEVLLGEGAHLVGSGEDCDVILNDQLIATRHVRITISGEQARFSAVDDGRVFIDGNEVAESVLEPFRYFTIGNTHLAIGPADAEWPNYDFPAYQLVTRDVDETPEPQADADAEDSDSIDDLMPAGAPPAPVAENSDAVTAGAGAAASLFDRRWTTLVVAAVILFAIVATVFVAAGTGGDKTASSSLALADLEAAIAEATDAESAAVTVEQQDGYYVVAGYVADTGGRQRIETAVDELLAAYPADDVELRVQDTAGLAASARNVLNMYARGRPALGALNVVPSKPGQVVVSGVIPRMDDWTPVRDAIRRDVPAIRELDDSQVRLPGQQVVRADGLAESPDESAVDSATDQASVESPSLPGTPRAEVAVAPDTHVGLPQLQVIRVVGGRRRLLSMADGSVVFEGGRVAGGYVVESIAPEQIVLSRDGTQHTILLEAAP